jgi:uncharacterized spore protein YtfJ
MSSVKELLELIGERIGFSADARRVYGEPVSMDGRTVIPVAHVRFGFGAGGGKSKGEDQGEGGGGGGGAVAAPVGALEITSHGARFIHFNRWQPVAIAAVAGFAAGFLLGRSARR